MLKRTTIAVSAAALAACAAKPEAPADSSPANPTAVIETQIINSGILGVLPFEINEKHYVRANMRRDESAMKGTGTFTGWMVTAITGEGDTNVVRLDSDKRWVINNPKKEYTECPAHGCPLPPRQPAQQKPEAQKQEPKQQAEKGCTMRIASNNFDVTDTGATRQINGFNTHNYTVAWVVTMRDPRKRVTTSTLNADVWTSPVTADMRQAFSTEAAFIRAYGASDPRLRAPKPAAERNQAIPPEVTGMMAAYLSALSPADRAALTNLGAKLSKIQGHPISVKIEWRLAGDACAAKESQASSQPKPSASGVMGALGGMFGSKKDEKAGDTPILSFGIEVKSLKIEPVRDSVFSVPPNYKRLN
jgi:hypothetical protein